MTYVRRVLVDAEGVDLNDVAWRTRAIARASSMKRSRELVQTRFG